MREITFDQIASAVENLCLEACINLPDSIRRSITAAKETEISPLAREILGDIEKNFCLACSENLPICQDTGMAVVFIKLGQEVHITGGLLSDAVDEGVRRAYVGNLRCSVVSDPLRRVNSGDNTPAVLHLDLVEGDRMEITIAPKGFGSENMSAVKMLVPADGEKGVLDFIVETAKKAGPNPCPPMVIGVGIGGTMEQAALLAKRMTAREIGSHHPDLRYAALEKKALAAVNCLGIGPAGIGGKTTALAVNIASAPTHIAGMPVAINICCHAARHAEGVL